MPPYRISIEQGGREVGSLGPYAKRADADADARAMHVQTGGHVAVVQIRANPASVTRGGKTKTVKNLGWLMKHPGDIVGFTFVPNASGGGELVAQLDDGGEFRSDFADYGVARGHFLDRRVFRGLPLTVGGQTEVIGTASYRAVKVRNNPRGGPTVDVTSLGASAFGKQTKITKRYTTQTGRQFARVEGKDGLFSTDVLAREGGDGKPLSVEQIKTRAYQQIRLGATGKAAPARPGGARLEPKQNPRQNPGMLAAASAARELLPFLLRAREVACTPAGRAAIQKALDTACPAGRTNPRGRVPKVTHVYKGHTIIGAGGLYTLAPYDRSFPTLKAAKKWLDGHVARERAR